jgi:hypothetical protein
VTAQRGFGATALLAEPTPEQAQTLEFVAQAFVVRRYRWPVFDYVEAELEEQGIDAWTALERLPRHPGTAYSAVQWSRSPNIRPQPETPVALTVLGLYQAEAGGHVNTGMVDVFLALLPALAEFRRRAPRSPDTPRRVELSSDEVLAELKSRGIRDGWITAEVLWDLLKREPPTWGAGGSKMDDGTWTRKIQRNVHRFGAVTTVEGYIEEVAVMLAEPVTPVPMAAPSPLGLVAAIDYLDTVWRLAPGHSGHLFELHSAQRTAQLAFPAATADEFDSRLSGLGEVLRSARLPPGTAPGRRERNRPLAQLEAYLVGLLPESQSRVERAVGVLRDVINVRDAGQHTSAGSRGALALAALGVGYPPASWPDAWNTISVRTIEALAALREELATLAP